MSLIRKHVAVLQAWACLALVSFNVYIVPIVVFCAAFLHNKGLIERADNFRGNQLYKAWCKTKRDDRQSAVETQPESVHGYVHIEREVPFYIRTDFALDAALLSRSLRTVCGLDIRISDYHPPHLTMTSQSSRWEALTTQRVGPIRLLLLVAAAPDPTETSSYLIGCQSVMHGIKKIPADNSDVTINKHNNEQVKFRFQTYKCPIFWAQFTI